MTNSSLNETYSAGDTALLQCISRGGPNNTYQWLTNDSYIDGEVSENLTLSNVTALSGGVYTCLVSNEAGNDNASTFVFIFPYIVTEHGGVNTSTGSTVTLVCDAEAFPDPEYLWLRSDGEAIRDDITNNSRNLVFSSIEFGDEGRYYCTASGRGKSAPSQVGILSGI